MREVVINSRIIVADPPPGLTAWCASELSLINPNYAKKLHMGFWVGNTPKTLELYEIRGNRLILPYGTLPHIMPFVVDTHEVRHTFAKWPYIDFKGEDIGLYPYQEKAVQALTKAKFGILQSPAGSGKTQMGIELIKRFNLPALWLTHTTDLLLQSMQRARRYMDHSLIGTITAGKVNIGKGVTFATVQTMANLDLDDFRNEWAVVVTDECFPPYTEILTDRGPLSICWLQKGDKVLTISENGGQFEFKRVTHVFMKEPQSLMKLTLKNGRSVICTMNHPILTLRGYVKAGEINGTDEVLCMRKDVRLVHMEQIAEVQDKERKKRSALLDDLCIERRAAERRMDPGTQGDSFSHDDSDKSQVRLRPDEKQKSDVGPESKSEGTRVASSHRTQAEDTRWQWAWSDSSAENAAYRIDQDGDAYLLRVCRENWTTGEWISDLLQTRLGDSRRDDSDRDRRGFAYEPECPGSGFEEDQFLEWSGVESIEIYEPGCDRRFAQLPKYSRFVYNLEVEDNHNYFANGINVHNCHHAASTPTTVTRFGKVLNALAAPYKFGLSATLHRSDGLIKSVFSLIGDIAYTVPPEAVEEKTMKVRIIPIQTACEMTEDCLKPDGTLDYWGLINVLCNDAPRNKQIIELLTEHRLKPSLILSERLDHLSLLMDMLPEDMRSKACMVTGKTKKDVRDTALDEMRKGEKQYLFATYALAREGLDIPRLEALYMATPAKDEAVVIQSVGRVSRTCEGKAEPVVYDPVDPIRYCQRAFKERCKFYRRLNAIL